MSHELRAKSRGAGQRARRDDQDDLPASHTVTRSAALHSDFPAAETAPLAVALYAELQQIARRLLRTERTGHTLETDALVHEAFLRLAEQHAVAWRSRAHFLSAAATTMRRVLVDYARRRRAAKRRGDQATTLVSVPAGITHPGGDLLDVLILDDAIGRLARHDERQARVVELRVFGGFETSEVADIVGVSERTVKRDWRFAKAWLACELSPPV